MEAGRNRKYMVKAVYYWQGKELDMTQIHVKVSDEVKKEEEGVLDETGMTDATDPFYYDSNMHFLAGKMAEYKKGTLKTSKHLLNED